MNEESQIQGPIQPEPSEPVQEPITEMVQETPVEPQPIQPNPEPIPETQPIPEPEIQPAETVPPAPPPQSAPPPQPPADFRLLVREAKIKRKQAKLEKILNLVRQKGKITNNEIQKLLRVSDATATRYAKELIQRNLLKKSGRTKASYYEAT